MKSEVSNFQSIWIKGAVLKKPHVGALKPDVANCNKSVDGLEPFPFIYLSMTTFLRKDKKEN